MSTSTLPEWPGSSTLSLANSYDLQGKDRILHLQGMLFSLICSFCRMSTEFHRSRSKGVLDQFVSPLFVPVRCEHCGHRQYKFRFKWAAEEKRERNKPKQPRPPSVMPAKTVPAAPVREADVPFMAPEPAVADAEPMMADAEPMMPVAPEPVVPQAEPEMSAEPEPEAAEPMAEAPKPAAKKRPSKKRK